ncbi:TMV resistance protein N [Vitis vinifera]|uniref:ADP-ribosyl cyclase/cyclic ADP-ribose hydrolase n=1 Tax=Vitis vinifera TaxID=29760 RepID=A0A438CLQ1_VITVI|nr:TMV resistance protein N [Vitis vinifera]
MASISTLKASSSSSNPRTYDVFLSFRGEDTRKTFTGHLYAYLVERDIHTFRDDEELRKEETSHQISLELSKNQRFLLLFSQNTMLTPSDVRNQGGSFKDAFLEHAKDADQEKKKTIETWENALKIAANLSGYHLQNQ